MQDRCDRTQSSFGGCAECFCALTDECTVEQLGKDPGCTTCKAWGADLCDDM